MKRIACISALVLALAACTTEPFSTVEGTEFIIEAEMIESDLTKSIIQDGTGVYWEPGDEVKLFFDGTGGRFTAQCTSAVEKTTFSGTLNVAIGFNEGFSDDTPLIGLYPYRADATADNTYVTTTLPAEQTGRADSFAQGTFITLAKSQSLKMGFYNVCGGIRFSLVNDNIKEVILEGRNDENLAGKVQLTFSGNVPVVNEVISGEKSITLTAPNGGCFEKGKWYYIVALPCTLSSGLQITFNTADEYAIKKSSNSLTIKRGVFGSLEDVDEGLVFVDKGSEPQSDNIVFQDPAAKYACVAKFDTNGDGEVSIDEAEAATSFDGLFTDWKTVSSFDEIKYFKNVTSIDGLFDECTKLVSITLPENITDLGTCAFSGCSSLTSVTLPSNITAIGSYAFNDCSKLTSIDIPSKVAYIGYNAFGGCSALQSLDVPSSVTYIDNYAFYRCSALQSLDVPSSVTYIGNYAFYDCSALQSINIPHGITSIPTFCFFACSSLLSVSIPSSVTSIGDNAFGRVHLWLIDLPASVKSIGESCFSGVSNVIVRSTSTVSVGSDAFSGANAIYVPQNLMEMYKVMTFWSDYASRLHPISSYKDKGQYTLVTSGMADMGCSVKWAACNLGANSPEAYGDYYAWGETETKSNYSWSTYMWCNGSYTTITKYCTDSSHGLVDNKTALDLEDDVAYVKSNGAMRMPTAEECDELVNECPWERTTYNGINGCMVYGVESGNKIFLPAAGFRYDTSLFGAGSSGEYGSASLISDDPDNAWVMYFSSVDVISSNLIRSYGRSVRPVCDK